MNAQTVLSFRTPKIANDLQAPSYEGDPCFHLPTKTVQATLAKLDWNFEADDTSFLAHDVHPYPAKFIPQIPGTLISRLSDRGEVVLDIFGGSGTTALEAIRLGRRAISIDANPLSVLIGRTKTASIDRAISVELHGFQTALTSELLDLPSDPSVLLQRHLELQPTVPNREKWFADSAYGELTLIKARILALESQAARDIALVAFSRIIIRSSFQDSETRYKSVVRSVVVGETLRRYLKEFRAVLERVADSESFTRHGISRFVSADSRCISESEIPSGSVDLVVTSPPYGNATDYHLYHRFRLIWLGFDPNELGRREIGSHLRHQREGSGFDSYFADLKASVQTVARLLRPGRYAALVLGDSIYEGERHDPAEHLKAEAKSLGFESAFIIQRAIHSNKRSFTHAGRRASTESILVLKRDNGPRQIKIAPPPYKLWPYERSLRLRECRLDPVQKALNSQNPTGVLHVRGDGKDFADMRNLVFSHAITGDGIAREPTWQATLENGGATNPSARKDPKYVTHGIHPYKGKFYPQLAKGLLNLTGVCEGARILDMFCGSGTTLLEGYLNGCEAFGSDMNPLAAKIARAKTEILECDPDLVAEAHGTIVEMVSNISNRISKDTSELNADCVEEIGRWFPDPVVRKLNSVLKIIRKNSAGPIQNYFEVVLSSVIREVSQQEPSDLRIRYRKEMLDDADLVGLFRKAADTQFLRIKKFWSVRGRAPRRFHRAQIITGDNRSPTYLQSMGLKAGSIDVVLTSPPYLTALPYIDTDRLSLLTIMGLTSSQRRPIEGELIGSREINTTAKRTFESNETLGILPPGSIDLVNSLKRRLAKDQDAGFRKQNMPALVTRYLIDMQKSLRNAAVACRVGGEAMIVIGDNRMEISGRTIRIPTTDLVEEIATTQGFSSVERIDISVTTENYLHQKNAITENAVLRLRKD